ncbi:MAG TPA: pitrilysin family protein [Vicinamibacterales bacterium]|nr:pitrilysin family protein [Vicinamibacterales bacterium]
MKRADRSRLPTVGPSPSFQFSHIHKDRLSNRLSLWSAEHRSLPVVTFILALPVGSVADFEGYEGLSAITADMMDEGTGNLSAIDVNAAFARIGAHLESDVSADATVFTVTVLAKFARQALSLLADCVTRPRMDVADFDRIRQLRLTRLVQIRDMPSAIADRAIMQVVYGTHPYAHMALGTEESLRQLSIETVKQFHAALYRPSNATLIASGDLAPADFEQMASDMFGAWADGGPQIPEDGALSPPPSAPVHRLVLVNKPGAAQSEIRIGEVGLARSTPDYHPLIVLNMILGGQFVSRINMKLRQEKGLTYGARTAFDFRRGRGPFIMQTSVQSDGTAEAIGTSLMEIHAIRTDRPPTPDEVEIAKAALTRSYPRNFETAEQIARAMAQLVLYGLPDDYFNTFMSKVCDVTVDRAREVAVVHLHLERLATAIVSDSAIVTPQLVAAGLGEATPLLPRL